MSDGTYQMGTDMGDSDRQADQNRARWEETFMKLYAEHSIQANTIDSKVSGRMGQGPDIGWRSIDGQVRRQQPAAPLSDLFLENRRQEKQSLDGQDIPLDSKEAVRRYFDSLEVPNR